MSESDDLIEEMIERVLRRSTEYMTAAEIARDINIRLRHSLSVSTEISSRSVARRIQEMDLDIDKRPVREYSRRHKYRLEEASRRART